MELPIGAGQNSRGQEDIRLREEVPKPDLGDTNE